MGTKLENAVELIKSEGFTGAHSFIFLTRWASLADDKALMKLIGNSLEEMSTMQESASLAYAYAEYYEAEKAAFCPAAVDFILPRCSGSDRMLFLALAKCGRVFGKEEFLQRAGEMALYAEDVFTQPEERPFAALGMLELYRATDSGEFLNSAVEMAEEIRQSFTDSFDPKAVYDMEQPSGNSAVAVLYDQLARITQEERWVKARDVQNRFISLLADKYPTRVAFGLCALLADEFEAKTILCAVPGGEYSAQLRALLSFYAPLTERIIVRTETEREKYFLMEKGELKEIRF